MGSLGGKSEGRGVWERAIMAEGGQRGDMSRNVHKRGDIVAISRERVIYDLVSHFSTFKGCNM